MKQQDCNVLSIVPYRILPATSGGHLGVVLPHHYLGLLCNDHIVSTSDNAPNDKYSFILHGIFEPGVLRYRPYYKLADMLAIARENNITHIYCDHPYMALTAIALSRKLGVPWYMRSHNIEAERFRSYGKKWWPIMRVFEKKMMRKANGVFFVTNEDKDWAITHYGLQPERCYFVPFGTTLDKAPQGREAAKKKVAAELQLHADVPWLYFLGAMDFYPNVHALNMILNEVLPRLSKRNIPYQVLIAGKGLSEELKTQISNTPHIQYAGFIPDLNDFLNANDIMLNAVLLGGGIKTKAVEALGYNKFVVSTQSGAAGLLPSACGDNLLIAPDNDWDAYTDHIISCIGKTPSIPQAFYDTYYWGKIEEHVYEVLQKDKK